MSTVTVRMTVKPERRDEFLRIFRDVAAIVEAEEDDCRAYVVFETANPNEYYLLESYRSEAGRHHHEERHAALMQPFLDCLAEPPHTEMLGDYALGMPA